MPNIKTRWMLDEDADGTWTGKVVDALNNHVADLRDIQFIDDSLARSFAQVLIAYKDRDIDTNGWRAEC